MMRRTLSLLLVFVAVLFLSCEDQLVSPETSTYLDGSSSATLTGSSQDGAAKTGAVLNFTTPLSGDEVVSEPVETTARGLAKLQLNKAGDALSFRLNVANIDDVIGAHIHMAPAGANGPIVVFLFGNPFTDPVTVNGTLAEGTITASDVGGPIAGDLDALIEAMMEGNTYVQVHTTAHMPGEIRGQIDRGNGVKAAGSYSTHKLSPDTREELAQLRRATARYQDVRKAQADGYMIASPFVPGMGFHYVNMSLVPDGEIDVAAPEALVYDSNDPQQKSRNLGAVEYIIPGPNTEAFQQNLPTPFTGQTTDDWHYEEDLGFWTLHVWIWLDNPEGIFHSTNPRVSNGAPTP